MPSATVMLKEGLSYSYPDGNNVIKFTQVPVTVAGSRELIDRLKTISVLAVEEHVDKPVAPLGKSPVGRSTRPVGKTQPPPPPEPEPEEESEPEVEDEGEGDPEATTEEGDEVVDSEETEAEVEPEPEPEPEPVKPAKGVKPGQKGKKG